MKFIIAISLIILSTQIINNKNNSLGPDLLLSKPPISVFAKPRGADEVKQPKKLPDPRYDQFGRDQFFHGYPWELKNERYSDQPGQMNTSIIEEGWLRIKADEWSEDYSRQPAVPKPFQADMDDLLSKPFKPMPVVKPLGGKIRTQNIYSFQNKPMNKLAKELGGMMVNPLFVSGKTDPVPCQNCFYFRLSGLNLQFTQIRYDMTIIASIAIKNIDATAGGSGPGFCFSIADKEEDNWTLCAYSNDQKKEWVCAVSYVLGKPCEPAGGANGGAGGGQRNKVQIIEEKQIVKKPVILIPLPSRSCNQDWNYDAKGNDWECKCAEGHEQSPLDLPPIAQTEELLDEILLDYTPTDTYFDEKIKIINDENITRVRGNFGSLVNPQGVTYEAQEVTIHTPSNHTILGKRYPMEVQIVHKATSQGDITKKAILSVLFERKAGVENNFIKALNYTDLPNPSNKEKELTSAVNLMSIWLEDPVNENLKMFPQQYYMGSLPYPPCDERTEVFVMAEPLQIGYAQVQMFKEALQPSIIDKDTQIHNLMGNYRITQQRLNRAIWFHKPSNCDPNIEIKGGAGGKNGNKKKEEEGHWEKVQKKQDKQFYVDQETPSGVPGSFVVAEDEARGYRPTKTANI